ncbi:hydroxymethylglutaryl-CoA synthase [Xylanimonas sp. McL0601]|uniref:hydroxymethylglutaryl-CoA synthase n=1 Tax=Xylanimonas sp. McL0601 TaxID=3414739 RepID=UPI003CFB8EFC
MSAGIGIHDLSLATGQYVLDLDLLAAATGTNLDKFHVGLGLDEMSVLAPDEDVVTLAASAALPLVRRHGTDRVRTLMVATESGVDQSKSLAVYVHRLLGLPASCRAVELKQACYGATAGLQAALGLVARNPEEQVLLIAADVARYEPGSTAEPTQGAGAVAMLVGAEPGLLTVEPVSGVRTADVDDFWRPNDRSVALVDGRLSVTAYLDALSGAWDDYQARGGVPVEAIDRFCYHQPFTRMATKAHRRLAQRTGVELDEAALMPTTRYNRRLGNSYTASLYAALASLLDHDDDLAGRRVALFSYGSGSVGELVTGVVGDGYRSAERGLRHARALDERKPVDVHRYRELHAAAEHPSDVDVDVPVASGTPFRFAGVRGGARRYEVGA